MKRLVISLLFVTISLQVNNLYAEDKPSQEKLIEIFKLAPGQHENFLRLVALHDEANRRVSLPPRDLYIHNNGADWDVMLIQPASVPENKRAALAQELEKLKVPTGAKYFLTIRRYIASHSDSFVTGPTTAENFLSGLGD